jgi:hypothetical protein
MTAYPQLTHFPVVKRLRRRTVINRASDGRSIKLADPAGVVTEWQLQYSGLSDAEAAELQQFFEAAEGTLKTFTFVDPTANLLAASGELTDAVWLKAPMLAVSGGPVEWQLRNAGGGPQSISQSIAAPGGYVYCFSLWARGDVGVRVTMLAGSRAAAQAVTPEWQRLRLAGAVDAPAFALEIPAGVSVEVRGMQVEAQAGASVERTTTTGGVYEGARFRDDALDIVATAMNSYSCTVNIVHAIHI